ncbi:hypothetical protein [Streptomyces alkaliterrae]|uniref:Peptidase inhibitor n=1 Tax=Streptomyces alkaliterrae TaxID=2213162 RepID=A0A5P0YWF4_9ACTN|nr:hypothetical protein [Streptomyces alkaliterrae]MBB1261934.1 hypothetical protein [Streptomyces alkaliterrae]MQS04606.1 hypothetical protein [Streptomyces alkaliterrae]
MRGNFKRVTVTLAVATGVVLATGTPAAQAATVKGCASGYVCMYQSHEDYQNGKPSHRWYTYGAHNLSNQFGRKYIANNQYGGAKVQLCNGYNGTNCSRSIILPDTHVYIDITPINSVKLFA